MAPGTARLPLPCDQDQGRSEQEQAAQHREGIAVGHDHRLLPDDVPERHEGLLLRRGGIADAVAHEVGSEVVEALADGVAKQGHRAADHIGMELLALRDDRRQQRRAKRAAEISQQPKNTKPPRDPRGRKGGTSPPLPKLGHIYRSHGYARKYR